MAFEMQSTNRHPDVMKFDALKINTHYINIWPILYYKTVGAQLSSNYCG